MTHYEEIARVYARAVHQHVFRWASNNTCDARPPDMATCVCGLTYGQARTLWVS